MIESPALRELFAERDRHLILTVLEARFGPDAEALQSGLNRIKSEKRLVELARQAGICPDLQSFQKLLEPTSRKKK